MSYIRKSVGQKNKKLMERLDSLFFEGFKFEPLKKSTSTGNHRGKKIGNSAATIEALFKSK